MSITYCDVCDIYIDTDFTEPHNHEEVEIKEEKGEEECDQTQTK